MVLIGVFLWIVLLWFLVGLCRAAQAGDAQDHVQDAGSLAHGAGTVVAAGERHAEPGDGVALAA